MLKQYKPEMYFKIWENDNYLYDVMYNNIKKFAYYPFGNESDSKFKKI